MVDRAMRAPGPYLQGLPASTPTLSILMLLMKHIAIAAFLLLFGCPDFLSAQDQNLRDYGIRIGVLPTGANNTITDVDGVWVGHQTIIKGEDIRTGVTAILPHPGNIFQQKAPAAVYVGNGFGKLTGSTQVRELGTLETPVVLTNTLSVPTAADALIEYTLGLPGNEEVYSVNPVVGETNDGYLNNIRGRHVSRTDVIQALQKARGGAVPQGNVGAGTGTVAFGFKGGIGTASRLLPGRYGGYTVGVLVQSNFGGVLQIAGVPVGKELGKYYLSGTLNESPGGSCMIVVATDAPMDARSLERLAKRAVLGLAKTGGIASNGSGDYAIAFSTAESVRIPYRSEKRLQDQRVLRSDALSPLFMAAIEATEEAIINSLFHAETMSGRNGHTIEALPVDSVLSMMERYGRVPGTE
ncbi:L-aminopeptidase DmpA. Serine peptidase. MEROPS family S58 [Fodinibius sediminis]|uniref:L-aminopeptidase DmpA. Serine peptidase. MEROPS family S58 n=2 Tax=Fodinibius sediminis TaxID=1214077 RepID=A0A521AJD3_9BACT|nr:L-aminopeptidase DmpA. Serine peptidase. MEROPS family S58 [Fodinibius sediminis]